MKQIKYYLIPLTIFFSIVLAQEETTEATAPEETTEATAPEETTEAAVPEETTEAAVPEETTEAEEVAPMDSAATDSANAEDALTMEEEVEEIVAGPLAGFSFGAAPSIGLVSGGTFTNVPIGATVVITTPWVFKMGPLDFTISAAFGGYAGEYDSEKDDDFIGSAQPVEKFNPTIMGIGGNLTLAKLVFAEGHAGMVGSGPGVRGFAGVSLEYLMKKGLNLPVNILVGGEGFISTDMAGAGNPSGWGGLGVRLDYDF
ncbi:MAG: hypothetical protein HOF42_02010 [Candidatus Marinimicrobia bacterium]|nr:hypothetical protein [Candidatus Neomarinimicrobiota bacterium]